MLLRSISKHVKDQNWFAVTLDFLIVVVCILIAFQITNWNEERGDRHREVQVLRDIATDIAADIDAYDTIVGNALFRIATLDYIFEETSNAAVSVINPNIKSLSIGVSWSRDAEEALQKGSHTKDSDFENTIADSIGMLWSIAVNVGNFQANTTALDALVNSGDLGVLRNKEVVRQLQEYRVITAAIEKSQDTTYRPERNAAIAVGQKYGLSVFGVVDEEEFIKLVSVEPELAAVLQTQMGWATGHYVQLVSANQSAHAILRKIQIELGKNLGG